MTHLYLFQIGPVQTFIAAARRTQDLLIGSRILSDLAKAGVETARVSAGFAPVFPFVQFREPLEGSVSHKFAFASDDAPDVMAARVEAAVRDAWQTLYASPVKKLIARYGQSGWEAQYDQQAHNWLEFYWVAVPNYSVAQHNTFFTQANIALNQRKYARTFASVEEPGIKCTLTGSQSALKLDWVQLSESFHDQNITLRPNEKLGTLALIKRLIQRTHEYRNSDEVMRFPSTRDIAANRWVGEDETSEGKEVAGYLAVLHMDGDRMGEKLSTLQSLEKNQNFSHDLSQFSTHTVPEVIRQHGGDMGRLVYSGGDDVLALLPLSHVLECADEIRKRFNKETGCTMSAGIAITPDTLPLDVALDIARRAEEEAKEKYGRNAVVVTEAHGTGQMRSAGSKWDLEAENQDTISLISVMGCFQAWFAAQSLSGKIGYDAQQIAHDLMTPRGADFSSSSMFQQMRQAEFTRVLKRRIASGVHEDERATILEKGKLLTRIAETQTWDSMANWLILARFLAGDQREEVVQ